MADDQFAQVETSIDRGEWSDALDLLDDLDVRCAAAVELRATALYGAGRFEACVAAWEELHAMALAAGDEPEAARAAAMIAMYLMMDTGLMAPVRGWLRTAERLAYGSEQASAHALVAMVRTYERFMCGDMATAGTEAERAIDLGERLDPQLTSHATPRTSVASLRRANESTTPTRNSEPPCRQRGPLVTPGP